MLENVKTLQFSCIVEQIKANKDRSMTIKLESQELSKEDCSELLSFMGLQIWTAFSETPVTKDDLNIPEALIEFKTDVSPSQRLRNILYVFWEKEKKQHIDWPTYYRQQVEKIIEHIKDKLD